MSYIVPQEKIPELVAKLDIFKLKDIGTTVWLDQHIHVFKLSQQATLEAKESQHELVKDEILKQDKLRVLLNQVYCVYVWKKEVFNCVQDISTISPAAFLVYAILYHEDAALTLIELTMYHTDGCEALADYAVDLIDYCVSRVCALIGIKVNSTNNKIDNVGEGSALTDIKLAQTNLAFSLGLRSIAILFFMTSNYSNLPVSAMRHLVTAKDFPSLLVHLLDYKPWMQLTKTGEIQKYIDNQWKMVKDNDILNMVIQEGQGWLCLRQLLLNRNIMHDNDVQQFMKQHFEKCLALLTDSLLDQLPVLIDLKQFLCQNRMTNSTSSKSNIHLIEIIPTIYEKLCITMQNAGGAKEIANYHTELFMNKTHCSEQIASLSQLYSAEALANLEELGVFTTGTNLTSERNSMNVSDGPKCHTCNIPASKKCSGCLSVSYCSRTCQKRNWSSHKKNCTAKI